MTKHAPDFTLLEKLDLPEEVSTQQAAKILGVDKKTVLKYREDGDLPGRDIAPGSSTRPVYRFPLSEVLELRTTYRCPEPAIKASRRPSRSRPSTKYESRHIQLDER